MNGLVDFIKTLGPTRIAAMGAVAAILVGVFAFIILRVTAPQMTQLYSNLSLEDSGAIINQLESMGVQYELKQDGAQIRVPADQVARLRMNLAQDGLPTGGSIGYEIFDRSDSLGATSFVQNINHLRAVEGELARSISSISQIKSARVHLVIPERQLFQRDKRPPSASIVLNVRGSLSEGQIRAVQHLAATAVEGLTPEHISVVDESGRLLASGADTDAQGIVSGSLQERANQTETRLRNQIEEILNSIVGPGRARVRVAADMDFNRTTETTETFDPEGQVVRSTQTKEEESSSVDDNGEVTVGNEVPNGETGNDAAGSKRDDSSLTEEIINYEISKATRTKVVEAGRITRLSVAVLVDGTYSPNAEGETIYTPRTQETLDRIAVLVRSAVGFDAERGDVVEVVNLQFAQAPQPDITEEAGLFNFTRDDIMRFAELGVLLLISIMLLLFVVRPLLRRIVTPEEKQPQELVIGPDGMLVAESTLPEEQKNDGDDFHIEWLEEAKSQGAMQASSINKVGEMIQEHPTDAVTIVRGWLDEAAA